MIFRVPHRRRIVYSAEVERTVLAALEEYERLDEVMLFFEWLLVREPDNDSAQQLDGDFSDYWVIATDAFGHLFAVPDVTLLYTFDDASVTFERIRIKPSALPF